MTDDLLIRRATEDDGEALGTLFENSPDEGAISFVPRFEIDPYVAYAGLRPETTGFVADAPDGGLAGVGFVSFTEARFGGERRPAALLNALAVHPDYRGRGLAKRLGRRRIAYARDRLGEDAVVFANIQAGNDPSEAVAESWADAFAYDFCMHPAEPRSSPPEADVEVREATPAEYDAVAERSNAFYADAEVYRPYDPDDLERRLAQSPIEEPLHRYVVATADGEVVAGAFVSAVHRVMRLVVDSLPPALEDAEELPPVIPESRAFRMTMVADAWHAPGQAAAARALWETIRAAAGGNRIMLNYDPDGAIGDVLGIEPGDGTMHLSVAVDGPWIEGDVEVAPLF